MFRITLITIVYCTLSFLKIRKIQLRPLMSDFANK